MGVTLERVQNKFACIIGELCSEPVVLSQFAIWLDLRLAEYKAKGAISLDCSGDDPDPDWMNGHRLPQSRSQPRERPSQQGIYGQSTPGPKHRDVSWSRLSAERGSSESPGYDPQGPSDNLPSVEERLSPSSVVVKEEQSEDDHIFPVSLHRHDLTNMSNRKRTAAEAIVAGSHDGMASDSHSPISSSAPKIRRVSPPADHDIHPTNSDPSTNQSLMSIISSGDMGAHPIPPETVDLTESDINIIMEYENKDSISHQRDISRPSYSSPAAATGSSDYSIKHDDSFNTASMQIADSLQSVGNQWYCRYTNAIKKSTVLPRIVDRHKKLADTVRGLVNAVGVLEGWLSQECAENRVIEEIPPFDLDRYLAEFFSIVKKPNGEEYNVGSFRNLRSYLDRFLSEKGYSQRIKKSQSFMKSREAFERRKYHLAKLAALRKPTVSLK